MTTGNGRLMAAVTTWLLLGVLLVIAVYDVYRILHGPTGATVSEYIHDLSTRFPVIPFGIGVLVGHLLWPVSRGH